MTSSIFIKFVFTFIQFILISRENTILSTCNRLRIRGRLRSICLRILPRLHRMISFANQLEARHLSYTTPASANTPTELKIKHNNDMIKASSCADTTAFDVLDMVECEVC